MAGAYSSLPNTDLTTKAPRNTVRGEKAAQARLEATQVRHPRGSGGPGAEGNAVALDSRFRGNDASTRLDTALVRPRTQLPGRSRASGKNRSRHEPGRRFRRPMRCMKSAIRIN